MANLQSTISSIGKSMSTVENSINKAQSKAEGVNKLPHVSKLPTHIGAEHGVSPYHAGNAATTGQKNAYSLPN